MNKFITPHDVAEMSLAVILTMVAAGFTLGVGHLLVTLIERVAA